MSSWSLCNACVFLFFSQTSKINAGGKYEKLRKYRPRPKCENTLMDHDSIHRHRNLNYTKRSAIARHRNFNTPKICKTTVLPVLASNPGPYHIGSAPPSRRSQIRCQWWPGFEAIAVQPNVFREMGLVRITSWYENFNGSHFGLPLSEIHRMTALPPKIVWTMTYSHRPHRALRWTWCFAPNRFRMVKDILYLVNSSPGCSLPLCFFRSSPCHVETCCFLSQLHVGADYLLILVLKMLLLVRCLFFACFIDVQRGPLIA